MPPAGEQTWRGWLCPAQAGPPLLPAAPSSPNTTTRLRAPEKHTCIFSTPMYCRKRCRSNVFPCIEGWMRSPVQLLQLLRICQKHSKKHNAINTDRKGKNIVFQSWILGCLNKKDLLRITVWYYSCCGGSHIS